MKSEHSIIYHESLGRGDILATRNSGRRLLVRFHKTGKVKWVNVFDIIGSQNNLLKTKRKRRKKIETVRENKLPVFTAKRRLIEALRLGIVPEETILDFTFGRENETKRIFDTLELNQEYHHGASFIIKDEYGKGKTHFLTYLRQRLLEQGYAVASVSFDPSETTPFRVRRVYNAICKSFKLKTGNKALGFTELLNLPELSLKGSQRYLNHYFNLKKQNKIDQNILNYWITGERVLKKKFLVSLPSMLNDYVAANLYVNLLTAISVLVQIAGGKGLVLLFDESESLIDLYLTSWQIKGENFLRGIVLASYGISEEENFEQYIETGQKWGQILSYHQESELFYSRRTHKPVPFLYQSSPDEPQPMLFPIFAFTPTNSDYYYSMAEELDPKNIIELSTIKKADMMKMFKYLHDAYKDIYHFSFKQEHLSSVLNLLHKKYGQHLRILIKAIIEMLDLLRFDPDLNPKSLLK